MALNGRVESQLRQFIQRSSFRSRGGVVTDLDGTAVHEHEGRIQIPKAVEFGLKRLLESGRPLVLNSLRFPLSVLRTFGREWYDISNAAIPCVCLNGSLMGYVVRTDAGELEFQEIEAFPLRGEEIDEMLLGVGGVLDNGLKDILVFYYPRDWRIGEVIWTPVPEKILSVKEKYTSASAVSAIEFPKLRGQLMAEEICMIVLLINVPQDRLMAYQHSRRSNFFTHKGVDKLFGSSRIASHLGIELRDSIGAGDTEMDRFLSGVGCAVHVGAVSLEFKGIYQTIKLRDSSELGELLFRLADLQQDSA